MSDRLNSWKIFRGKLPIIITVIPVITICHRDVRLILYLTDSKRQRAGRFLKFIHRFPTLHVVHRIKRSQPPCLRQQAVWHSLQGLIGFLSRAVKEFYTDSPVNITSYDTTAYD